jgi:hypothetical protein
MRAAGPGVDYSCLNAPPKHDPAPGSAAWQLRDTLNQYCATLRLRDQFDSTAYGNANKIEGDKLYAAQLEEQAGDEPLLLGG